MATLADQTPGSVVKISENGTATNFLVLQHGYPQAENGRTLLLREALYNIRQWNASANNYYASSSISTFLGSTYLNLLDESIKEQIVPVEIAVGTGTISQNVFLLSYTEIGASGSSWAAVEGNAIPYFDSDAKRIANYNGSPYMWWLRTARIGSPANQVWLITETGASNPGGLVTGTAGCRPAFTVPSSMTVDDDGSLLPNAAPPAPAQITVPQSAQTGDTISITWSASTDPDGDTVSYILERSINSEAYTQRFSGTQTQYSDTISYPCAVTYRVKAVDESGGESGYTESTVVSILMNYSNLVIGGDI